MKKKTNEMLNREEMDYIEKGIGETLFSREITVIKGACAAIDVVLMTLHQHDDPVAFLNDLKKLKENNKELILIMSGAYLTIQWAIPDTMRIFKVEEGRVGILKRTKIDFATKLPVFIGDDFAKEALETVLETKRTELETTIYDLKRNMAFMTFFYDQVEKIQDSLDALRLEMPEVIEQNIPYDSYLSKD